MNAEYLKFIKGNKGDFSFVGRQPTHLPDEKPWPAEDDDYFGFFLQLDISHLNLPDIELIQFYQPFDDGDVPIPYVIPITNSAIKNVAGDIGVIDKYGEWEILRENRIEPIEIEWTSADARTLFQSKIGGVDPWGGRGEFLMQLAEQPIGFNFGGTMISLYINNGGIHVESN